MPLVIIIIIKPSRILNNEFSKAFQNIEKSLIFCKEGGGGWGGGGGGGLDAPRSLVCCDGTASVSLYTFASYKQTIKWRHNRL